MKFRVEWQDFYYNESDDLDGINTQEPFEVEGHSPEEAIRAARALFSQKIKERYPFPGGSHSPQLVALVEENGTRHQIRKPQHFVRTGQAKLAPEDLPLPPPTP